jgi:hypothetical protein
VPRAGTVGEGPPQRPSAAWLGHSTTFDNSGSPALYAGDEAPVNPFEDDQPNFHNVSIPKPQSMLQFTLTFVPKPPQREVFAPAARVILGRGEYNTDLKTINGSAQTILLTLDPKLKCSNCNCLVSMN